MNLLKEKPDERQREDLSGYRHTDWWLDMGHVNPPKISSEPWSDQWWMTIALGKEESAAAAEPANSSLVDNNSTVSTQVVSELTVSAGAVSDSKSTAVLSKPKPPVDTSSTMLDMLYAKVDDAKHASRHHVHDKNSLKGFKKYKKISLANPERLSKKES